MPVRLGAHLGILEGVVFRAVEAYLCDTLPSWNITPDRQKRMRLVQNEATGKVALQIFRLNKQTGLFREKLFVELEPERVALNPHCIIKAVEDGLVQLQALRLRCEIDWRPTETTEEDFYAW